VGVVGSLSRDEADGGESGNGFEKHGVVCGVVGCVWCGGVCGVKVCMRRRETEE